MTKFTLLAWQILLPHLRSPPLRRQEHPLGVKMETTHGSRLPSFHNLSLFSVHPRHKRTTPISMMLASGYSLRIAEPRALGASAETVEVGICQGYLRTLPWAVRTACNLLFDHTMLLRGHSTRACQLPDLFTLEFENEGVTPCWPVIMVMD